MRQVLFWACSLVKGGGTAAPPPPHWVVKDSYASKASSLLGMKKKPQKQGVLGGGSGLPARSRPSKKDGFGKDSYAFDASSLLGMNCRSFSFLRFVCVSLCLLFLFLYFLLSFFLSFSHSFFLSVFLLSFRPLLPRSSPGPGPPFREKRKGNRCFLSRNIEKIEAFLLK